MGLYDMVLGDGHQAERGMILLGILGYPSPDMHRFPPLVRFRDAWVERHQDGELVIAVYARQGGPNREDVHCGQSNAALALHPLYLRDADDRLDATYCTFYFSVPPKHADKLAKVAVPGPVDMSERWEAAMGRMQRGDFTPREIAAADQLFAAIADDSPGPKVIRI
jgi:hypothetical protein